VLALPFIKFDCIIMGFLLAVFSSIGDLAESFIKRCFRLKDMGSYLPGTGGILDRLDGVLFNLPLLYFYITFALPITQDLHDRRLVC